MPVIANTSSELVLSVILVIAAAFHDGLTHLDQQEYQKAIDAFTVVIGSEAADNTMRHTALFFRAHAWHGLEDDEAARKDLRDFMAAAADDDQQVQARTLFLEYGGDEAALGPEHTPPEVWQRFIDACRDDRFDDALAMCTGDWKEFVVGRGAAGMNEAAGELGNCRIIQFSVDGQRAFVTLEFAGGVANFELHLEQNHWLLARHIQDNARHLYDLGPAVNNTSNLKHLAMALLRWRQRNDGLPPTLDDLLEQGMLEMQHLIWTDPESGEPADFLYRGGDFADGPDDAGVVLAAAPACYNGERSFILADGRLQSLPEADFVALIKGQGWIIESLISADDVPAATREAIVQLIEELGNPAYKVRANAIRKLRETHGAQAILKEYVDHPDPEVRENIRHLLKP